MYLSAVANNAQTVVGFFYENDRLKISYYKILPLVGKRTTMSYREVVSSNISCLEAPTGFFRVLMIGISYPCDL